MFDRDSISLLLTIEFPSLKLPPTQIDLVRLMYFKSNILSFHLQRTELIVSLCMMEQMVSCWKIEKGCQ